MTKTATPARTGATLASNLDASGMNCQTARQSATAAPCGVFAPKRG